VSWRWLRKLGSTVPLGLTLLAASAGLARAETRSSESRSNPVLAGGTSHACAIVAGGHVACWGSNSFGQLGNGAQNDAQTPTQIPGLDHVVELAAGDSHTCALLADGTIECWGDNSQGQLGRGTFQPSSVPVAVSTIGVGTAMPAIGIAAGAMHTCAVLADGTVTCWGDDDQSQLGDGNTADQNAPPSPIAGISDAVAITAGADHTCVLLNSGLVMCWGRNTNGQVGDGTLTPRSTPTLVSGFSVDDDEVAVQISAGRLHTCAATIGFGAKGVRIARVKCWGFNGSGQLGDGSTTDAPTAVVATAGTPAGDETDDVRAVAAGGDHSCVVLGNGALECWGENADGQTGDNTVGAIVSGVYQDGIKVLPTMVRDPKSVHAISLGYTHSCRLVDGGSVECWGSNLRSQMATGTFAGGLSEPRTSPDVSASSVPRLEVAAGGRHSCGLVEGGGVKCWGRNDEGQLGDGTTTSSGTPVSVERLADAVAVSVGRYHSCAVIADGTVQCWGDNSSRQVGDPDVVGSSVPSPFPVYNLTGIVAVTCGDFYTCALNVTGAVQCWGENGAGQLGNGTTDAVHGVDEVVKDDKRELAPVRSISAGGAHTCGVDAVGTVHCWGDNSNGELGDGTFTERDGAVSIVMADGLAARTTGAGSSHTCAVASDGTAQCWGTNYSGQLGGGTTLLYRKYPGDVVNLTGINLVTRVAGGGSSACALLANGTLQCWAGNVDGQLGIGTNTNSFSPVAVTGLSSASSVAAGAAHTCAVLADGTGWCWGSDSSGQLGDSSSLTSSNVAVQVASFP
jgi:alpha-tubulin suppressor-like RCC1 family protein